MLDPGQPFQIELVNSIGEDTIVHWHGQKPPYLQDGVDDRNVRLIAAGKSRGYAFRPTPGTHWMHSHRGLQEQSLLAAPLIVRREADLSADVQEVTVLLHDFSFREPEEILAGLTGGSGGHDMEGMDGMPGMAGMDHAGTGGNGMAMPMAMDLNDVEYDAFLANDRTLDDPAGRPRRAERASAAPDHQRRRVERVLDRARRAYAALWSRSTAIRCFPLPGRAFRSRSRSGST